MKKIQTTAKTLLESEIFLYLVFGVLTTIVSLGVRFIVFSLGVNGTVATIIGDIAGILFAFVTNDRWVFRQEAHGWPKRLVTFTTSRLFTMALNAAMSFLFVDTFPHIIGQFVGDNMDKVNMIEALIAQVLIIVLNYVLSKVFVFKNDKLQE